MPLGRLAVPRGALLAATLGAADGADDRLFAEAAALALEPPEPLGPPSERLCGGGGGDDDDDGGDEGAAAGGEEGARLTNRLLAALTESDHDPAPAAAGAGEGGAASDDESGGGRSTPSPHSPASPPPAPAPAPAPVIILAARDFRVTFPARPLGLTLARAPSGAAQVRGCAAWKCVL